MEVWSWPSLPIDSSKFQVRSRIHAICGVLYLKFSRIHLTQIISEVLIVYGQYIIIDVKFSKYDWNRDAVSFPLRVTTVLIPLRMNTERCRREEDRNLYPLKCRMSAGRPFRQKPWKCCQENPASSWCHHQGTFLNQCTVTKYASYCPYTKY